MSKFRVGQRVVFNEVVYTVAEIESPDALVVKRVGQVTPITIPADQARPIMEEGKDTNIDRNNNMLKG